MGGINEQYELRKSFYHLEIVCQESAVKCGRPVINAWTNADYIRLSSQLYRQTDVLLSPSTLKRIFGKLKTKERYYPQKATRDTLARYTGFASWEEFVLQHPFMVKDDLKTIDFIVNPEASIIATPRQAPLIKNNLAKKWAWIIAGFVAMLLLSVLWVQRKSGSGLLLRARLVCLKPEGESPHTATFRLQLPAGISSDDMTKYTIDFGDGFPEKKWGAFHLLSHFYDIPGRYFVILKYEGYPTDTSVVYLKTNGWTATAKMQFDTVRSYPVHLDTSQSNNQLRVTANDVYRAGIDTNRTFFVNFVNTKPLNISADNFELTLQVLTSQPRPAVRCSQIKITIFGERSQHSVVLIKPGCVNFAFIQFSNTRLDGETEDLGFLGGDLTRGGRIKLIVTNKKVTLLLDDKKIFHTSYTFPLQKIYGLNISFAGIGSVNNWMLKDLLTGEKIGKEK